MISDLEMECDTSQSQQPQGQENKKLNARKMIEKYYHQLTKVGIVYNDLFENILNFLGTNITIVL